jgi:hypothetical protein
MCLYKERWLKKKKHSKGRREGGKEWISQRRISSMHVKERKGRTHEEEGG